MFNIHGRNKKHCCTYSSYQSTDWSFTNLNSALVFMSVACVIYEWCGIACIYQCQSDMCGVIIYSVTQIYVLKGYKTTLQPSHPIS